MIALLNLNLIGGRVAATFTAKVGVLALGMLTCMSKAFALMAEHNGDPRDLASIPAEDPRTYSMIRKADTIGTFQIESRVQMSMLPRLKPQTFYDFVIQVAIVRPGPIQGDMVHPYLRRREGKEPVEYASSWVKCRHLDAFCAALLNSQPMGFYAPAQIVSDARAHGVEIKPICVNASRWDCTLKEIERGRLCAARLGMRMVKGLSMARSWLRGPTSRFPRPTISGADRPRGHRGYSTSG